MTKFSKFALVIASATLAISAAAQAEPETYEAPSGHEETETFVSSDGSSVSIPGEDSGDSNSLDFNDGWDDSASDDDTTVIFDPDSE